MLVEVGLNAYRLILTLWVEINLKSEKSGIQSIPRASDYLAYTSIGGIFHMYGDINFCLWNMGSRPFSVPFLVRTYAERGGVSPVTKFNS